MLEQEPELAHGQRALFRAAPSSDRESCGEFFARQAEHQCAVAERPDLQELQVHGARVGQLQLVDEMVSGIGALHRRWRRQYVHDERRHLYFVSTGRGSEQQPHRKQRDDGCRESSRSPAHGHPPASR